MKKVLTTDNIRYGQLLIHKKSSVLYNTFKDEVFMYIEPEIEDWGYISKNRVRVLNIQTLYINTQGLAHLRKA